MRKAIMASAVSYASRLRCLVVALTFVTLIAAGCGGSGGGGGLTNPPTPKSVSNSCNPYSINTTQTSTCQGVVTYSDGSTSNKVSYTMLAGSVGSVTSAGVFSSAVAGSATVVATSTENSTISGNSATITVTAASVTVSSVSMALNPTSGAITMGQTLTCTGTVTYSSGPPDNNVNYTATDGTITSSGVFSPTAPGPASCKATAVKDSTKSATGNITVTAAPPTPIVISGISPNWFFNPTAFGPLMTITGSGFAGGQLFYFSGYPNPGTVSQGNPSTTIQFSLNGQMRPRLVNVYGTQADGTGKSNTVPFATLGTMPIAAACNDYIFADSQGPGSVRRFNRTDGTSTDFSTGTYNGGIAADCNSDGTTNFVIINEGKGLSWADKTWTTGSGAGDGNSISAVEANNHVACTIEPSAHEVWCVSLAGVSSTQKFSPAIGTPEALGMTGACGGTTLFVLDAQGDGTNPVLYSFSVGTDGTLTPGKSVTLPGFTPASKFTQAELENFVNWQVSVSQTSCTAAVMAPVLNASAGTVSFSLAVVNGTTMTETTSSVVALPSGSNLISEDDVHSATLVYVADVSGTSGVSRTWSRANTASGALTQLSSTSTILNVGPILSPDGSTIDVIGWDPANDSAGLELQSVPNK
ncbi:MAG TPA: hypothetical protein VIJ29_04330 [Candidatus Paceibacterota bacterium]